MEYEYKLLKALDKTALTPMMQQYLNTKLNHMDALLFYRMGDFYELFFDDAVIAAKILDIALTKRGTAGGDDIAMCGVPHHSHVTYLNRLIKAGHKVAICEQMETPEEAKKRGYKAVVRREVIRVVTPATISEDNLLESSEKSYLLAIAQDKEHFALAYIDISTGEFLISNADINSLNSEIARISPNEIIAADSIYDNSDTREILRSYTKNLTLLDNSKFDERNLANIFNNYFEITNYDGLASLGKAQARAICGALEYIKITQIESKPRLNMPRVIESSNFMHINASTRANLELTRTLTGEYKGSLTHAINYTCCNMGARQLASYIANPLLDISSISARQDVVQLFYDNSELLTKLTAILANIPDLERAMARICVGRASVNDLVMVRSSLQQFLPISTLLLESHSNTVPVRLKKILDEIGDFTDLLHLLKISLKEEPSFDKNTGGFVRSEYSAELDEYRKLKDEGSKFTEELQNKYRQLTGISNLKIKENNMIGLFVEVNPQFVPKMTEEFIHRQGLANAVRYTTEELRKLEQRIISAKSNALALELEIFNQICAAIITVADNLSLAANAIAELDVLSSFATLALAKNYARPVLSDNADFKLQEARHAVVENAIDDFIPNDINLEHSAKRIILLTGPNMAGKSTYLRQNALIAILAQIGCFVPAQRAELGIVDRIYSRVGASDNLAKGQSTFMVEMLETAEILNNATEKSFIILDEIGRGTSTYDGLSIAWAVLEELNNRIKARSIFATHYHELTKLEGELDKVKCKQMEVKEFEGSVIFTHKVLAGKADKSYGINVASLAGIPNNITARANNILSDLESDKKEIGVTSNVLPIFDSKPSLVEQEIARLDIDNLTPRDALDFLYRLKDKEKKEAI